MQINLSYVILCGWWNKRQIHVWALIGRSFFQKTEESEPPVDNRSTKAASLPIIYMITSVYNDGVKFLELNSEIFYLLLKIGL